MELGIDLDSCDCYSEIGSNKDLFSSMLFRFLRPNLDFFILGLRFSSSFSELYEELEEEDGIVLVTADYKDFGTLNKAFEDLGFELTKAKLERISNNPQEFSEEQQEEIGKLLEKLEDDDDVQAIYTNIA